MIQHQGKASGESNDGGNAEAEEERRRATVITQSQGFTELEKVLRGYFKVPRRPPALSHIQQHLVHLPLLGTRPPAPRCATGGQRGKCVSDARDSSAERRGYTRVYTTATPRDETKARNTTLRSPEALTVIIDTPYQLNY